MEQPPPVGMTSARAGEVQRAARRPELHAAGLFAVMGAVVVDLGSTDMCRKMLVF